MPVRLLRQVLTEQRKYGELNEISFLQILHFFQKSRPSKRSGVSLKIYPWLLLFKYKKTPSLNGLQNFSGQKKINPQCLNIA